MTEAEGNRFSVAFVVTSLWEQPRASGMGYFFEKHINSNFIKSNLELTCASTV